MQRLISTAFGAALASGAAFAAAPSPGGGPVTDGAAPSTPHAVPHAPAGLDDALHPMLSLDLGEAPAAVVLSDAGNADDVQPRSAVGPLPAQATMRLEYTFTDAGAIQLVRLAERAWSMGDDAAYRQHMDDLTRRGFHATPTYSFHEPITTGRTFGEPVVITANATHADLAFDQVTGNLFTVVNDAATWTFHISTDNGATWTQTFSFGASAVDVDLAVVGGFAYVAYTDSSGGNTETRLRRFDTVNGVADGAFFFQAIHTAPALGSVLELDVETNVDSFGNRIFVASIMSDNTVLWSFADPNNPPPLGFTPFDPPNLFAESGLDMHWDTAYDDNTSLSFLHMSYVTTFGDLRVISVENFGWLPSQFVASPLIQPGVDNVAVAAHDNTVIVGYITQASPRRGAYRISYDNGVTYSVGTLLFDNTPTIVVSADVAARLGYGTGFAVNTEAAFDSVLLQRRPNYTPGPWLAEQAVNPTDALSGGLTRVEALPTISTAATYSYGVLYELSSPVRLVFTRVEDCAWLGDTDGDGDVELDDLLTVLANFGTATTNGDTDGNGFVDLTDLLTVLAEFGSTCAGI